eukprot:scaffold16235_cov129-Isochrysis_galbana.AAC.1
MAARQTTPLMKACAVGGDLSGLLQAGAELNAQNNKGLTALMVACTAGHQSCATALIRARAGLDASDDRG